MNLLNIFHGKYSSKPSRLFKRTLGTNGYVYSNCNTYGIFPNRFNVNEVLSILEEENDNLSSADIFITPPSGLVDSECDSDDDDEPASVNHLSGRQLVAEAQCNLRRIDGSLVRIGTTENDSIDEYSNESEEESVLVIPEKRKRIRGKISAKTSKKVKPNRRWKEQDIKKDESLEATSKIPRLIEKDLSPC